jgi:glutathione synthase/RimK-type ligase-like ATP-grasp enzyme
MKIYDVVILTDPRYVDELETGQYSKNVYLEDNLLKEAIQKLGMTVSRKSWDDATFDWSSTRFVIFRTTWDYFDRYPEFSTWLDRVSTQTILLNSEKLIRWNIDKHYMQDLQKKGVHICETYFVEPGETASLLTLSQRYQLNEFVLKPCISGGSRHTYKITSTTVAEYETIFADLIAKEAMMLQPFQQHIVSKGEISLMVLNGKYTHGVLKIAKAGDFRVQDDYGGSVHDYEASPKEIAYAEQAVKSCPEMPIYARVDVFLDNQYKLALAELELIEPELWFRNYPEAAMELAKGIKDRIRAYEEIF